MKRKNVLKGLVVLVGLFLLSVPTAWAQEQPCNADMDCTGKVDLGDLNILKAEYFQDGCCPSTQCLNCEASGMIECECWVGNGGLCVDNSTDESNCGSCGNTCESDEICDNGTCVAIYPPAPVPKTGQTTCYNTSGTPIDCTDTGQDGDHKAGVEWPNPRFTDNGDGTVTDNLTGLIWLKKVNCFGQRIWANALTDCNTLNSGECGLTDGSIEGDWRLPNRKELFSLTDDENYNPPLPTGHPFTGVQSSYYWSSTTTATISTSAWYVFMNLGYVINTNKTSSFLYVWPVRGGND